MFSENLSKIEKLLENFLSAEIFQRTSMIFRGNILLETLIIIIKFSKDFPKTEEIPKLFSRMDDLSEVFYDMKDLTGIF